MHILREREELKFFAESGMYPAAGLFSLEHFLILIFCLVVLIVAIDKTIKNKTNNPDKIIKIISIVVLLMEISKIVWGSVVGRYAAWYDYLPLWFCSLFIPISLLAAFSKGRLKHIALTFMFYGGIVGGTSYLFFPTTSIGRYPVFHFITFHSMFYHTIMIYMGFFVIYHKLIKPTLKDLRWYIIITTFFCLIALILNPFLDTNYMFLDNPSNNPVLNMLFNNTGKLYPFIIIIAQNFGTFFISLGLFKLLSLIKEKRQNINEGYQEL